MARSLAVLGCLLLSGIARGQDWPEHRGPTGQGVAAGRLPDAWGPDRNVAWRVPVAGLGWSSPAVVAGKVYLTTAVPQGGDHSLRALCLDAKTGAPLWDVEVFKEDGATAPRIHAKNSHASPTPLVSDGRVYVHFGHMGTACLDPAGKVLWRNVEIKYQPVHGNGGSPALVDGVLVFGCDGGDAAFVVGLDAATGQVKWKTPRGFKAFKSFSFSTPLAIEVEGKKQVVLPGSEAVMAYEPQTGKEVWRVRYAGFSVIPRPVSGHGMVYVCTGYTAPTLLAIRPTGQGDVTASHVAWTAKKNVPHSASPLLVGEELYMVSDGGIASCLKAKTGEVLWSERLEAAYSASPVAADGKVCFQSEDGVSSVVKAGPKFELLGRHPMKERTLASVALADGALFLRTDAALYRFDAR